MRRTNSNELQQSILDKIKADTSVAVAIFFRNLQIDAKYLLLFWSPSITDDNDFLFNVENMTQHEEEESIC